MKLELEIPNLYPPERVKRIFDGINLVAYQYPGQPWMVKTSKCSHCGNCCEGFGEVTEGYIPVINGRCKALIEESPGIRVCELGSSAPFACLAGINSKNRETCTEKFEEVPKPE